MEAAEFKEIRLKLGLTQSELGDKLGITKRQIINYEKGGSKINSESADMIRGLIGANNFTYVTEHKKSIMIPIFDDVVASAGYGLINDEVITRKVELERAFLREQFGLTNLDNLSIITAQGDSMTPTIPPLCQLLVQKRDALDGQICVVRVESELYVKRIQKLPTPKLLSDNEKYEAISLNSLDYEIIGVVVGMFQRFV
ncbi:XRE family transcriptional regulator [Helicobacter sp.]|uniref:XRE family transcriptional regulator n=1 Tax=Helicobacter sp. TaxID=218 RepID=UPI0025BB3A9A|nr:XRE family transcriptional regulator [Helicobacter sp.]MCI5968819.1 XRE family transcriptional regulator [Helicobacter sp.]